MKKYQTHIFYFLILLVIATAIFILVGRPGIRKEKSFYTYRLTLKQSPISRDSALMLLERASNARDSLDLYLLYLTKQFEVDITQTRPQTIKALELAKKAGQPIQLAYSYLLVGYAVNSHGDYQLGLQYLDSAKTIAIRQNDPTLLSFYYNYLVGYYTLIEDNAETLKSRLHALQILEDEAPWARHFIVYQKIKIALLLTNGEAFEVAKEVLADIRDEDIMVQPRSYYLAKFNIFLHDRQYDSAEYCLHKIDKYSGTDAALFWTRYYEQLNQPDQAIRVLRKSIASYDTTKSYLDLRMLELSRLYFQQNSFDSAWTVGHLAWREAARKKEQAVVVQSYNLLARIFIAQSNYDSAAFYLQKSTRIASDSLYYESLADSYQLLSVLAQERQQYQQAYDYYQKHVTFKNKGKESFAKEEMQAIYLKFAFKKVKKDSVIIQKKARQLRFAVMVISFLALLLLIGFLFYLRLRARKEALLHMLNDELKNRNAELEEKVKLRTAEIQRHNEILEGKNKRLENYAFFVAHRLRSPVATLLGLVNLFGHDFVEEKERLKYLKLIKEQLKILDDVIREAKNIVEE